MSKNSKFAKLTLAIKDKLSVYWKYLVILASIFLIISLVKNLGWVLEVRRNVEEEKMRLSRLKRENERLKKQAEEVAGSEFIEKQLRDKLSLAKPGEIVLVLPDEETLKKLAPETPTEEVFLPDPIWKQWVKLFF
jgi:cell division protein FtsB